MKLVQQRFHWAGRDRSLRPLRAVGYRLSEPEAIGPIAYAPVGER
jgi:hypothetical protein